MKTMTRTMKMTQRSSTTLNHLLLLLFLPQHLLLVPPRILLPVTITMMTRAMMKMLTRMTTMTRSPAVIILLTITTRSTTERRHLLPLPKDLSTLFFLYVFDPDPTRPLLAERLNGSYDLYFDSNLLFHSDGSVITDPPMAL